jgi:hypothetical protein
VLCLLGRYVLLLKASSVRRAPMKKSRSFAACFFVVLPWVCDEVSCVR